MKVPGFVGPTYKLRASTLDAQRCINLYPELDELGTGKDGNVAALIGTPGLDLLMTVGVGPVRGLYTGSNGMLYVCSGNGLYRILTDTDTGERVSSLIGTLSSTSGRVSFADNGTTLCLVDGISGYVVDLATHTLAQITDPDFEGADTVAFLDGYFVFNKPGTGQFYISALYGTDFDALDFATAEANPDNLLAVISFNQQLWMFGSASIEAFYNSGNQNGIPFDRMNGAVMAIGCQASKSINVMDNTIYWLGADERGSGVVYAARGFSPVRISTHAIEYALQQAGSLSDCTSYTYQQEGHYFYCLNVPAADTTLVYDVATKLWHERAYTNQDTGQLERHRADCYAFAYNQHVVGDYENGKLYVLNLDTYTDAGDYITRLRASPHFSDDAKQIFYFSFQLDIEVGVGIDGSGQGSDPQVMLQWSNDGAKTWSNEHWRTVGTLGTYRTRVRWLRLGRAYDRVWRLKITDPIKVSILGAYIEPMKGST